MQSLQGWAKQACNKAHRAQNVVLPPMQLPLWLFLNPNPLAENWHGMQNVVLVEVLQLK
jgi:hypothetical protein